MYWAEELAKQNTDNDLKTSFDLLAGKLKSNEDKIVNELNEVQGAAANIEGYYFPSEDLKASSMRPSTTLNEILSTL
jgi:isocitrate dehydrogenase